MYFEVREVVVTTVIVSVAIIAVFTITETFPAIANSIGARCLNHTHKGEAIMNKKSPTNRLKTFWFCDS